MEVFIINFQEITKADKELFDSFLKIIIMKIRILILLITLCGESLIK